MASGRSAHTGNDSEIGANARMAVLVLLAISLYVICVLSLIRLTIYFRDYFYEYLDGGHKEERKAT